MSYVIGLACAIGAVLVAAASSRGPGPRARWTVALALTAGTLVFYTVFGDPGLGWIRTLDCVEVGLASLLPLIAIATSGRRYRRPFFMVVPTALFLAVLALSLTDAVGLTYYITGWLPGIGIALAPRVFSDKPFFFGAAMYCLRPVFPVFVVAAAGGTGGALGVAVAKRDRRLAGAVVASICLFLATFLTRDLIRCVPHPRTYKTDPTGALLAAPASFASACIPEAAPPPHDERWSPSVYCEGCTLRDEAHGEPSRDPG